MEPRDLATRIADSKRRLESDANVWIATASPSGEPHLVALSLWWDGSALLATTPAANPIARNIAATGLARASLESADDVVTMKTVATATPLAEVDGAQVDALVEGLGWDPRDEGSDWVLLTLTPDRVWAWTGLHEIDGRTIMRNGAWLA